MKRRNLLKGALGLGLSVVTFSKLCAATNVTIQVPSNIVLAGPKKPVTIYNNWSAYDELSDNIPLTEALAMKQLNELIRLKKSGVQVDYYVMDAFWFDKAGGYRTWHKERWPNGPYRWLNTCKENNIIPGMWFSTNDRIANGNTFFLELIPEWKDSATTMPSALSLFRGGYLKHLTETLQMWADKGVGAFKFDFARFEAASEETQSEYLQAEIVEMNKMAFIDALKQFRQKNPSVLIIGYNGFGGEMSNTYTPFRKSVDSRWLQVFDSMYCGDPRFSDVPTSNIWRSADIYSDHMVRQFELNGLPIHRIDNCGFMIGVAGTCYKRAKNAWKGMQILELARGGWINVYHGNLELFTEKDAQWFAKTQRLFTGLQQYGLTSTFGEIPGKRKPYGFISTDKNGTVCTVVNPSQAITEIELPVINFMKTSIIYADSGFIPMLKGSKLSLGPEQLVVIGFDEYSQQQYYLGVDDTVIIPVSIEPVAIEFKETAKNTITGLVLPVKGKDIRILVQQYGMDKNPRRSSGGPPPNGKKMDTIIKISVTQKRKTLPMNIQYDKMIWSGLSWAAAELKNSSFNPDLPLEIKCMSTELEKLTLKAEVYAIHYQHSIT
jgi:hypothetical protein